jgi:hypothetical protein
MFGSLPAIAKIWIFAWTYLAVSGWFSTYMLISLIGGAGRNDTMDMLIPGDAFILTAVLMTISSFTVIGLFFYGRYTRKKKDVAKAALKKYEETGTYTDPNMRFDPSVLIFWIGGSVLNILFCMTVFVVVIEYADIVLNPPVLYALTGFCISFFGAVIIYLVTQFMANGILDARSVKKLVKTIVGSDETKNVISAVCRKLGIADIHVIDRIYDKVRDKNRACEYSELTPDEVLLINRAIEETKAEGYGTGHGAGEYRTAEGREHRPGEHKAAEHKTTGHKAADGSGTAAEGRTAEHRTGGTL